MRPRPQEVAALCNAITRWEPLWVAQNVLRPRSQASDDERARSLGGYLELIVGTRRFRPFARLRFSTTRPALVLIRVRKPCVRFRRIRLG